MPLADGIHEDITWDEYNAEEAIRISSLVNMSVSPKYYRWCQLHPKDSEALRFGRAVDLAVFEPELFGSQYVRWTGHDAAGNKVIKRGHYWEDLQAIAGNDGQEIIDEDDYQLALEIRKAVWGDPLGKTYLHQGHQQVSLIWHDQETGYRCKARLDWLSLRAALVDLKTARSVLPRKFQRDGSELEYHVKMAWYSDALDILGRPASEVVLLAVEKTGPLDVVCFDLDDETLAVGRFEYRRWLDELRACIDTDTWPGIARGKKVRFEIPRYKRHDFDNLDIAQLNNEAQGLEMLT